MPDLVGKLGAFAGKAVGALKGEPAPAAHHPMGGKGGRPVPGRLPAPNTDPSKGWWEMLTTGQGIGAEAAEALLHAIDEGGPQGTREILASYERLLAPTLARAVKVQAADRMRTLLETLWHMRAEKGWEREAGEPSDAAEPGGAAAAEGGGEAGVPDAARFGLSDIDLKVYPEAAPLVAYFKSLGPDAEGYFRSYRQNLIPYFQAFGDEAEWTILEIAGGGVYVAAPGMSGPEGWIQRSPVALQFQPEAAAKITAPITSGLAPRGCRGRPSPAPRRARRPTRRVSGPGRAAKSDRGCGRGRSST